MRYGKKIKNILPFYKKIFLLKKGVCLNIGDIIEFDGGLSEYDESPTTTILILGTYIYVKFIVLEDCKFDINKVYDLLEGQEHYFYTRECGNLTLSSITTEEEKIKGRILRRKFL